MAWRLKLDPVCLGLWELFVGLVQQEVVWFDVVVLSFPL